MWIFTRAGSLARERARPATLRHCWPGHARRHHAPRAAEPRLRLSSIASLCCIYVLTATDILCAGRFSSLTSAARPQPTPSHSLAKSSAPAATRRPSARRVDWTACPSSRTCQQSRCVSRIRPRRARRCARRRPRLRLRAGRGRARQGALRSCLCGGSPGAGECAPDAHLASAPACRLGGADGCSFRRSRCLSRIRCRLATANCERSEVTGWRRHAMRAGVGALPPRRARLRGFLRNASPPLLSSERGTQ